MAQEAGVSDTFYHVAGAMIGLATIAVIFSTKANTQSVIQAGGAGFSKLLRAALSPITGTLSSVSGITGIRGTGAGTGGAGFGSSGGTGTQTIVNSAGQVSDGTAAGSTVITGTAGVPEIGDTGTGGDANVNVGGAKVVADPNTVTNNGVTYKWTGGIDGKWIAQ